MQVVRQRDSQLVLVPHRSPRVSLALAGPLLLGIAAGAGAPSCSSGNGRGAPASVPSEPTSTSAVLVVPGLPEPLVSTRPTSPQEDVAIRIAVEAFRAQAARSDQDATVFLAPLAGFVAAHPHSGWAASAYTDLGLAYYRDGYFSRAFDAFEHAWQEGREAVDWRAKAVVDRAVGELARMHARVGHADALEALFSELGDRPVTGVATELVQGAREGAWIMRNTPGVAFLCGPRALAGVLRELGASPAASPWRTRRAPASAASPWPSWMRWPPGVGLPHQLINRDPIAEQGG